MEFYEWLHQVTSLGYDENIMIPAEKGDIIENLFNLNYTPKEALEAYKRIAE